MVDPNQQKEKPLVSVSCISKSYQMGDVAVHALRNVSLTINKGDFVIITGRNGSGKSTLLHQLGLLDRPDTGVITLNQKDVTQMAESERSVLRLKFLGYVFQEYALITELSALENVMLSAMSLEPLAICRQRATTWLNRVGLGKKLRNLPSELSGGEQQKVAIARALVNNPEVIFADEPTANLDTIAAHDVLELFKGLNGEGHTIAMVTHEPEEVAYGNRQITLQDGRIL